MIYLKKTKKIMKILLKMRMGNLPEEIDSSALNTWVFNEDTIRQVLHT